MIVNIRGSSCSGKSTNMYQLLQMYPSAQVWERTGWNKKKHRCVGHLLPGGLFLVGPYIPPSKTGGMDMLMPGKTELVTLWLERNCVRYPFVIFESMMASLAIGRYHDLRLRLDAQLGVQNSVVFLFMDTPMETCRQRIYDRNGGLGPSGKGINEEATVVHQWNRIQQIRAKLTEKKEICYDLDHTSSTAQLDGFLKSAGWDPFSSPPITIDKVRTRYTLQDVWDELHVGFPDDDPERIKRFKAEMEKHADRFPV